MQHVPAIVLWLVVATAGTSASPVATSAVGIGTKTSASSPLPRLKPGPLRTSLEAIRASLAGWGTACPGVDSSATVAQDETSLFADGVRRSAACLAAAQVSGNTPSAPSQHDALVYFVGTIVLVLVGWLISKL